MDISIALLTCAKANFSISAYQKSRWAMEQADVKIVALAILCKKNWCISMMAVKYIYSCEFS